MINNEIILNIYAQNYISRDKIEEYYKRLDEAEKKEFLQDLIYLVKASNAKQNQMEKALVRSGNKETINYFVMLKSAKNGFGNNILRIKELKDKSFYQGFALLLELFKVAFEEKKDQCILFGNCHHWWHENLGDMKVLDKVLREEFNISINKRYRLLSLLSEMWC